ncbi:hypothetical protein EQH57_0505, partial [Dictyocoela roeselum]
MDNLNRITIIQHNVRNWKNNKFQLSNSYSTVNPHVIIINSHGNLNTEPIKIFNYDVYSRNSLGEQNNGIAVAIRRDIQYRINEDYYSDFLSVTLKTNHGDVQIGTAYVPFRIGLLGDINARHRCLGHQNDNIMGKQLSTLLDRGHATHIGPYFPTFITHRSKTTPDIILSNRHAYHNFFSQPGPPTSSDHLAVIFTIST